MLGITYQDYESSADKLKFVQDAISTYKSGEFYKKAVTGEKYFKGENEHVMSLKPLRLTGKDKGQVSVDLIKIPSKIFSRLVVTLCSFTLSSGGIVDQEPLSKLLGDKADRLILQAAQKACIGGLSYLYCSGSGISRVFSALEMFTLNDEWSNAPKIAIRFWETESIDGSIQFFQIYDMFGVTSYKCLDNGKPVEYIAQQPHISKVRIDGIGKEVVGSVQPEVFPIVRLQSNEYAESELTAPVKSKIDAIDELESRNAMFASKTTMIYWLLNSTGDGDPSEIANMIKDLENLGIAVNDGSAGLSAEPKSVDPNVRPRLDTIKELEDATYKDAMSLNTDTITGGSLTNVAINTATAMLRMKSDELYYYVSDAVAECLAVFGKTAKSIEFKQTAISNDFEIVQMIYMTTQDTTAEWRLTNNPMVSPDDVAGILENKTVEQQANLPTIDELQAELDKEKQKQDGVNNE